MSSPPDSVGEGIYYVSGCSSAAFVRPFVRSDLLLPRYLVNSLSNLDETREIFISPY